MHENTVIKGGSKKLDQAKLEDFAVLELHAVICEHATVRGKAVVGRSTICGHAVVEGTARVRDAIIGGNAVLSIGYVGKNGNIMDSSHLTYMNIRGIGYTVHRTWSEAKGYSAQIMREDGTKITANMLRELVEQATEYKVLQYLFNQCKKTYTDEN